jgi:hypothetical protein
MLARLKHSLAQDCGGLSNLPCVFSFEPGPEVPANSEFLVPIFAGSGAVIQISLPLINLFPQLFAKSVVSYFE